MTMFERIAVTGGSGLLGTQVIQRLAGTARLTNIDRNAPRIAHSGDYQQASITDYDAMKAILQGHDALIHLAAIPNPREASAETTFHANVQGAWCVMQAAEDAGVRRVVVASSDSVFGLSYNPPDWKPHYLPVDEAHPVRPREVYSLSKKVTETIAASFAVRGQLEVLAVRPSHIIFPRGYGELETRAADLQNYHFWAWIAPEDAAQVFDRAINMSDYRGFDVFTAAAIEGLNTRPTLDMATERWGTGIPLQRPETYDRLPTASVLDTTKAREILGYTPAVDRGALVKRAAEWLQTEHREVGEAW